ncbi:MAG: hypothetical protein M1821_008094 [Bathelium mastoideum]|nr:MAG: hypothetical protein M1821_008094 [Bathelium mastoideum]KAI9693137.1 MAG: hypothetical protein M1822_005133 [Bathelium mastoideum]
MPVAEIDTRILVHDAFRNGKQVFVPYIYRRLQPREGQPSSVMDMLELKSADEYESLNRDSWGIPTLPKDSIASRSNCFEGDGLSEIGNEVRGENDGLDLLVMPGLVFDMRMGRVGHGKGFYDFFLQRYKESNDRSPSKEMPFLVGLALGEQVLSSDRTVPRDASDWLLDALVTGHGRLLHNSSSRQAPNSH